MSQFLDFFLQMCYTNHPEEMTLGEVISGTYETLSLVTKRNGVKNLKKGNNVYRTPMFMKKKSGNV